MAYRKVDESSLNAVADAIRVKTGGTEPLVFPDDMVAAIETLGTESVTYPLADEPETLGQRACLARAAQMRDIQYTTVAELPNYCPSGDVYAAGKTLTGMLYSSVRASDNFIGQDISLHTFMTAMRNPNSVLYTKDYNAVYKPEGVANGVEGTWYGTNCSSFVAYALGMPYHPATAELPLYDSTEIADIDSLKLCDYLNSNGRYSDGTTAGHTVLVTGIWRDKGGLVQKLEITDHGMHSTPNGVIIKVTETRESFLSKYVDTYNYKFYRYNRLYESVYTPSPYVPLFDEPTDAVVYSDLCTDLGDKVTLTTEESITVQPLTTEGYTSIVVYRDGALIHTIPLSAWDGSAWTGDEGVFNAPVAGRYTAVLVGSDGDTTALATNSTSWIVCAVGGYKDGNKYYFTYDRNCRPLAIVLKDGSGLIGADGGKGLTLGYFEPTEEDIARGYMTINASTHLAQFNEIESAVKWVAMSFINEYGCCHKGYDYVVSEDIEVTVPEEYVQLDYIEMSGGQYVDTGVLASNYPDGITYNMKGNCSGFTVSDVSNYFFGALSNGVRSGNVFIGAPDASGYDAAISLMCGASSDVKRQGAFYFNQNFELSVTASSELSDTLMYINGSAATRQSYVTTGNMPSASIYLFACNGVDTTRGFKGKCYSFSMTDAEGNFIRNFVPCYRVSDNVIGLYDTVGGVFYANAGTGSFTKDDMGESGTPDTPSEMPTEYQQVEYIATDGNQYIDTGVVASDHADGIAYTMSGNVTGFTNASGNNYLFGCLANSSRSGNPSFNPASAVNVTTVFVGGNSNRIFDASLPSVGADFTLAMTATSANESVCNFTFNDAEVTRTETVFLAKDMPSANIYLFTANGVAATNGKYYGKLYSFTMDDVDGTPIRNFVPCYRVADGVIGLYDTVGGAFYTNIGTGSFTKGSDV